MTTTFEADIVISPEDLRTEKARMLYEVSGVPYRYRDLLYFEDVDGIVDVEDMAQFEEGWRNWIERAEGDLRDAGNLYLWGPHGTGKTCLACLCLLSLFDFIEGHPDPLYMHAGTFVSDMRSRDSRYTQTLIRQVFEASVLVLDDIGAEAMTEFSKEQMTILLESRWGGSYPNIFTGNVPPESLEARFGGRIAERVLRDSQALRIRSFVDHEAGEADNSSH